MGFTIMEDFMDKLEVESIPVWNNSYDGKNSKNKLTEQSL